MDNMTWRICPNHPAYQISDCGDLAASKDHPRYKEGMRIRGTMGHDGYIMYKLEKKRWVAAHTLVAEAFLPPPKPGETQVAHRNNSRIMNYKDNLRWATPASNQNDRIEHGTVAAGTANGRATITDDDVRYIRKRYAEIKLEHGPVSELDNQYGLCRSQIIRIAKGDAWSHVE